jgi:AcrR family transcriptional regulator
MKSGEDRNSEDHESSGGAQTGIVEAALDLFIKKGYDDTTIQDIAEKLQIAQGLCHRYFKSKQELFSAAADAYASKFMQQIHDSFLHAQSPDEKCNLIMKRLLVPIVKDGNASGVFHCEDVENTVRVLGFGGSGLVHFHMPPAKSKGACTFLHQE